MLTYAEADLLRSADGFFSFCADEVHRSPQINQITVEDKLGLFLASQVNALQKNKKETAIVK